MQPELARSGASQSRRLIEVTAAVVLWIAIGLALRPSPNAYLLLGIPLTAAFQLAVCRRPLRALWLREAPPFSLDVAGWAMAAALAVFPGFRLVQSVKAGGPVATTLWFLA